MSEDIEIVHDRNTWAGIAYWPQGSLCATPPKDECGNEQHYRIQLMWACISVREIANA